MKKRKMNKNGQHQATKRPIGMTPNNSLAEIQKIDGDDGGMASIDTNVESTQWVEDRGHHLEEEENESQEIIQRFGGGD